MIGTLFQEFIQFFALDIYDDIDFSKPPDFLKQELYKEIIDEKKGKLIADEIVKVFLKNGEEKWILIHVEVQGSADENFGERMLRYFYRIYDQFNRKVYALALITDHEVENANGFHYSYYDTKVDYTYHENKLLLTPKKDNTKVGPFQFVQKNGESHNSLIYGLTGL